MESEYPNLSSPEPGTRTSTLAVVSLVTGIVSWFALPIIGGLVAVITGHMAKREIRESVGQLNGGGLATAGLILGYLNLGLFICVCIVAVILILAFTAGVWDVTTTYSSLLFLPGTRSLSGFLFAI